MKILFGHIEKYSDMLIRIEFYTFVSNVIIIYFLTDYSVIFLSSINTIFKNFPSFNTINTNFYGVQLVVSYLLVAVIIAYIFRIVKMHDKISDIFNIRKYFDVYHILLPLSIATEISINNEYIGKLFSSRKKLMRSVFYYYTSSTDPKIDKHSIWTALDQWSIYWIIIELMASIFFWALVILLLKDYALFYKMFSLLFILTLMCLFWIRIFPKYAQDQIDIICSNKDNLKKIRSDFNAL
ncbi:MAG: hypothetical protein WC139_11765 [Candidatus Kapaibacterium sp.]